MKIYIGDGIYAELVNGELILTTSNGVRDTNRIVFGPEEWVRLTEWVDSMVKKV